MNVGMPRLAWATDASRHGVLSILADGWRWLKAKQSSQIASKRLRVIETVSLGEKRFVAVIQCNGEQFLIGGAANAVCLLTSLQGVDAQQRPSPPTSSSNHFADVLERKIKRRAASQCRDSHSQDGRRGKGQL